MWITMLRDDGPYLRGQTTMVRASVARELIARRAAVAAEDGPDPHLWGQPERPTCPDEGRLVEAFRAGLRLGSSCPHREYP